MSPPFLIKTLRPNKNSILGPSVRVRLEHWSSVEEKRDQDHILFCEAATAWAGLGRAGGELSLDILLSPSSHSNIPVSTADLNTNEERGDGCHYDH